MNNEEWTAFWGEEKKLELESLDHLRPPKYEDRPPRRENYCNYCGGVPSIITGSCMSCGGRVAGD